jgi:hypothetical protein
LAEKNIPQFLLYNRFILYDIFQIKPIEMCKSAVPAPDGKIPAPDKYIVGSCDVAVPAIRGMCKVPGIITINFNIGTRVSDIFNAGDKNTDHTTIIAYNLGLIGNCMNDLVRHFFAMVTISVQFHGNERGAHEKYWRCTGSLICCNIFPEKYIPVPIQFLSQLP